jgi:threonine aldolase
MRDGIDLRSDTVTTPTPEMWEAMNKAEIGDDVFGEDKTVIALENLAAEKLGKESGLFVASGTMGNLLATLAQSRPGDEAMVENRAHTYYFEHGMAAIAGVMPTLLDSDHGIVHPHHIKEKLRGASGHESDVALLFLENTHNLHGGTVASVKDMDETCEFAKSLGMRIHVDGARLFNAAVALGVNARELVRGADTVMVCLAKSLCAPVGSVLVGDRDTIKKARGWRSVIGGGMRQAGILAAAGIVALETMVDRLREDHENAKFLGEGLSEIPGITVDMSILQTNLVYGVLDSGFAAPPEFEKKMKERNVYCFAASQTEVRFATHKDVSRQEIETALSIMKEVFIH